MYSTTYRASKILHSLLLLNLLLYLSAVSLFLKSMDLTFFDHDFVSILLDTLALFLD